MIAHDECQLWWAGRELQRGKRLQEFVGKNEKTKLVVKISKVVIVSSEAEISGHCQVVLSDTVESISAFFSPRKDRGRQRESP